MMAGSPLAMIEPLQFQAAQMQLIGPIMWVKGILPLRDSDVRFFSGAGFLVCTIDVWENLDRMTLVCIKMGMLSICAIAVISLPVCRSRVATGPVAEQKQACCR